MAILTSYPHPTLLNNQLHYTITKLQTVSITFLKKLKMITILFIILSYTL